MNEHDDIEEQDPPIPEHSSKAYLDWFSRGIDEQYEKLRAERPELFDANGDPIGNDDE